MLAVFEGPAFKRALRLDPQFVVIGANPSLSLPAELGIAAAKAALELVKDEVGKDALVHHRLHGAARFHARHQPGLVRSGRCLRRREEREQRKRSGKGADPESAHSTRTSRNIPISMW